jgi:hypothetical protein
VKGREGRGDDDVEERYGMRAITRMGIDVLGVSVCGLKNKADEETDDASG